MTAPTDLGTPPLTSSSALAAQRPGSAAGLVGTQQSPAGVRAASPAADELLKSAFRQHAAGVAVITAQGERPVGFTATSLTSVAADPPLISFGVGTGSSSWPVVAEAEYVGVHILGEHQQELAATFARSGADRFALPTCWRTGPEGVPVLEGVVAWLVARVVARVPAGDHRLVIAEVVTGDPAGGGRPLLYHQGRFKALRD
ncbi:flavin reductase family protein [Streptomyces sp. PKU-EA00015]|uniref:flavin reductase family protein n=1 Tax=Streptomyces sp. PKU-EA00015 TaxID=2748326 RepID=UPI0015A40F95|nr:flavin reductase family protein [Streptomyces sp. PKU-EA00015]NWF25680.1 flavin reductase family protein [Streptomyces sp. PKU-EA00015]